MKTTIDLPEDLILQLKFLSARESRKLKDVAAEIIRQGLRFRSAQQPQDPKQNNLLVSEQGFPVYKCRADAPATKSSIDELLQMEQDAIAGEDSKHVSSNFSERKQAAGQSWYLYTVLAN